MNKKEDLVLIHGLLGSLSFFNPEDYLSGINVRCPDLHGYGHSPLTDKLTLQNQVDFVKSSIEEAGNRPCWLLGNSVGGAVVNMLAAQQPELVKGIINVEGNFTINDAFWCQTISEKPPKDWQAEYEQICTDPDKWLEDSKISFSPQRSLWAKEILAYQSANTVQAVAKAVVTETDSSEYLAVVNKVVDSHIPVYLVAGEYSVNDWDLPQSVKSAANELCVVNDAGHMMMLEKPTEFCRLVQRIIVDG